ncbi:hypothetical protein SUDANB6_02690 [Streptomyces sp. enrichment culture]|uniref:hypothetical protein n=1 Tax=Streptomyces sp. enrichment culture TaxID=1795815 RepID=UPI003F560EC2
MPAIRPLVLGAVRRHGRARALIERIRGGASTSAGEGEPFAGVLGEGEENPYGRGKRRSGGGTVRRRRGLAPHVA